jgi:hypothetical protein
MTERGWHGPRTITKADLRTYRIILAFVFFVLDKVLYFHDMSLLCCNQDILYFRGITGIAGVVGTARLGIISEGVSISLLNKEWFIHPLIDIEIPLLLTSATNTCE